MDEDLDIIKGRLISMEKELYERDRKDTEEALSIINDSDGDIEERKFNLERKGKQTLQSVIPFLDNSKKSFTISNIKGEQRTFTIEEFDCESKDTIDTTNRIRIYLGEKVFPHTTSFSSSYVRKVKKFEALIYNLKSGKIPLYDENGAKIHVRNVYLDFTLRELKDFIVRHFYNFDPLKILDKPSYIRENRSYSIENMILYYNKTHPEPWSKEAVKTKSTEIQRAIGIDNPIEIDRKGIGKDTIVYCMLRKNMPDLYENDCEKAYEILNFPSRGKTIDDLFEMDDSGETIVINRNKNKVRNFLTSNWSKIHIQNSKGRYIPLGLSTKIKYFYERYPEFGEKPKGLTHTAPIKSYY